MKLAGFIACESTGLYGSSSSLFVQTATRQGVAVCIAGVARRKAAVWTGSMYILQFDGMLHTSGNERMPVSLLGYGWIIQRNGLEVAHGFGLFLRKCKTGSNIAEYLALIDGLEALVDLRLRRETVEIRGDAKCVIDQMTGYAGVSSPLTIALNRRARNVARRFTALTWTWVPRRENRHADKLSRRSFHYLRCSPHLDREIHMPRFSSSYDGRLIPLLDLRVHTPITKVSRPLTNR